MKIIGLSVSFICAALFLFSVLWGINVTFLFIALFLSFSSFQNLSDVYYERSYIKNFSAQKTNKPVEIKTYAVKSTTPARELIKFIHGNHYTQFALLNEQNQVIKVVTETQLLSALGIKPK